MMRGRKIKKSDFWYDLPKDLVAQEPIEPRDHSRLFVYSRSTGKIGHEHFYNLVDHLLPGDLLVLNNTKVRNARLLGTKQTTGGKVEVFLLKKCNKHKLGEEWQVLLGGKVGEGLEINLSESLKAIVLKNNQDSTWQVAFSLSGSKLQKEVDKIGHVPLPPYIRKGQDRLTDKERYQTVFSNSQKIGSAAAPTAGLHFTPELLKKIKTKGVNIAEVTLHVGLGTFATVKTDNVLEHKMHSEYFEVSSKALGKIVETRQKGGRVIAVGTTAARTLESLALRVDIDGVELSDAKKDSESGWTDIFIHPGKKFKVVDGLVTNFHLPESTLLMLVSAFIEQGGVKVDGVEVIQQLYSEAITKGYRFFSYGDAMLIV